MESGLLHDAKLIGLTYEPDNVIRLLFVTDQKLSVSVFLGGVVRFVATNLLDGNIVLDALSTKLGNLDLNEIEDIVKKAFSEEFHANSPGNPEWEKWISQIKSGKLNVFVIEPSYGAEIVAVCAKIDFSYPKNQNA